LKEFIVVPKIVELDTIKEFEFKETDLILTNEFLYKAYFNDCKGKAIFYEKYGAGEPTDLLVEAIYADIKDFKYERMIGIGGGAILDVAKIFALNTVSPVVDLFEKRIEAIKSHELILIPTTCGTGSEVTCISILALTTRYTKFGLADKALYADKAILIPELLENLPYKVFATSSIDALIHSIESFTSPKANEFTRMYSERAMKMILEVYKSIAKNGKDTVKKHYRNLLIASCYAGIAFSNAGCAAVHAMSYPLGAKYHVPHGESNYVLFTAVYRKYMELDPNGSIGLLNYILSSVLSTPIETVYESLDKLLEIILPHKNMSEYGVKKEEINEFTVSVMERQGRLMANNYCKLDERLVKEIYESVF